MQPLLKRLLHPPAHLPPTEQKRSDVAYRTQPTAGFTLELGGPVLQLYAQRVCETAIAAFLLPWTARKRGVETANVISTHGKGLGSMLTSSRF